MLRWACTALFLVTAAAFAQQPIAPKPITEAAKPTIDHRITLNVVVTDKAGKPVTGLGEQDFVLLNNKQPQRLVSFRAIDATKPAQPVQVYLLIDMVNTGFDRVAYERDQLKQFLAMNGGKLTNPTSLVFFTDTGTQVQQQPTTDGTSLVAEFDNHAAVLRNLRRSTGVWGAAERMELSLKTLGGLLNYELDKPGRKAVLWISPGWAYFSGPNITMTDKQEKSLFAQIVALTNLLRQSNTTVYSIDPLGTADSGGVRSFYWEEFLKGVTRPRDATFGNLALQVIATESGGRVLQGSNDVAGQVNIAANELNNYYELTFDAPPGDHADEYHSLQVKLEKQGLTAHALTGYYAEPGQ